MKYSEDPTRQYHIQVAKGEIGEYVILPGDPKRCGKIAAYLDNPVLVADSREFVTYTGTLDGVRVSCCSTGIGGPSAAIAVQELVNVGAKNLIRIGTSGGMQDDVLSGDLVIASGAVRAEGTTREYAPIEYPAVADPMLTRALYLGAEKVKARAHIGVVQSKDSFYGQHSPEIMPTAGELDYRWNSWIKMGCLASEMEAASIFIVSSFLRVRAGAVFLVMANQEREKKGLANPVVRDTDLAIRSVIEAIRILIHSEDKDNG